MVCDDLTLLNQLADNYMKGGLPFDPKLYLQNHISRYNETLRLLPSSEIPIKVLDIGFHAGYLSLLIKKHTNCEIFGIDVESDYTKTSYWEQFLISENIHFKFCDLTQELIPFPDQFFDLVLFCEVVEHLPVNPTKIFAELKRVIKTDGFLIFSTDNLTSLPHRLMMLSGKDYREIRDKDYVAPFFSPKAHFRLYSVAECEYLLKSNGFQIEKLKFWCPPLGGIKHFFQLICKIVPSFAPTMIFKAKKVNEQL